MRTHTITLLIGLATLLTASCKREEVQLYSGEQYVQFIGSVQDTIVFSFFFYPGQSEVQVPLPVKLVGFMPDKDLEYTIAVHQEGTTAAAEHFTIPSSFTFRKGLLRDTAYITVKNRPNLATNEVRLAFYIKDGTELQAGQSEYAYRVIKLSDRVSKPVWWDANMDRFYLGNYSELKFRKFMEVTGVGDLTTYSDPERRVLMLRFKYYLIEMKENGTPLLLEDGSDMLASVPLIG